MSILNVQDFPTDPLASPALTGMATAPTPPSGDNSTNIATTAFVQAAISAPGLVPSRPAPAAPVTIADGTGLLAFGPYILNSGILLTVGSGAGSAVIDVQ